MILIRDRQSICITLCFNFRFRKTHALVLLDYLTFVYFSSQFKYLFNFFSTQKAKALCFGKKRLCVLLFSEYNCALFMRDVCSGFDVSFTTVFTLATQLGHYLNIIIIIVFSIQLTICFVTLQASALPVFFPFTLTLMVKGKYFLDFLCLIQQPSLFHFFFSLINLSQRTFGPCYIYFSILANNNYI